MKITFLGTGSMVPTKKRNHSGILFSYKNENILIDCGEGTQRQFRIAGLSPAKISRIFITHWHGDHVFGLMGLLSNMDKLGQRDEVLIYGPKGSKQFFKNMWKGFSHNLDIKVKIVEINKGKFFERDDFYLECLSLGHHPECLGFNFVEKDRRKIDKKYLKKFKIKSCPELKNLQLGKSVKINGKLISVNKATKLVKGKKISIVMDTGYCENILKLCKGSDLLISEATFLSEIADKAERYKHLTAKQVGEIARKCKAKKLVITHFSQRYGVADELLKEVKRNFKNVTAAEDFMEVEV